MTLTDQIAYLKRWAANQATDCDLAGATEQADNFKMICGLLALCQSQAELIRTSDEVINHYRAEVARLESLVFKP